MKMIRLLMEKLDQGRKMANDIMKLENIPLKLLNDWLIQFKQAMIGQKYNQNRRKCEEMIMRSIKSKLNQKTGDKDRFRENKTLLLTARGGNGIYFVMIKANDSGKYWIFGSSKEMTEKRQVMIENLTWGSSK